MQNKELLKQVLVEQRESIIKKDLGIKRDALIRIKEKSSLPHVHVISGLRRSGKSILLRQIISEYYNDQDFYYINFEDERLFNFPANEFNLIYECLVELFGLQKTFFIDEIQNVRGFEQFVRRFYEQEFKFFITGSNANLLSSEIATKLTGRHIDTYLQPFSYLEFLRFRNVEISKNDIYKTKQKIEFKILFSEYLHNGGMPEYLKYRDSEILTRTYNDIVLKDIIVRNNIGDANQLKILYQYLINNYARRYSYNSLKKACNLGSPNTVNNYVHNLEQTYFIKQVHKFDYSLKKQIINDKKSYIIDNGFIRTLSVVLTRDDGWLLENLVFNILNENFQVFYYSNKYECDFICMKDSKLELAVQVTYELNEMNEKREVNGLLEAMETFNINNGLILTNDTDRTLIKNEKEIKIIPVWKFLIQASNSLQ